MMQGVYAKLNPILSWRKWYSTNRRPFSPANEIKLEEETANVLHLKQSFFSAEA